MEFQEFLNPKSMLTPAVAGALVMLITNTLWIQFGFEQRWIALVLSYLFAFIIVYPYHSKMSLKTIYVILNGLIIFSFAASSNFAGQKIAPGDHPPANVHYKRSNLIEVSPKKELSIRRTFFDNWFDG